MARIDTKGLPQMLADQAVAAQASAGRALDFSTGSILRAIAEGFASIGLWFQAMLLRVLAVSRLATSSGEDVDSFTEDFGLFRIGAFPAQGTVTLTRTSPVLAAFVPVGALVRTGDGAQTFAVVASEAPSFDAGAGGYTLPAGIASLDVPVAAVEAGTEGNVGPGTISLLASVLPGIDAVRNAVALSGGAEAETDLALKARFPRYLASLARATRTAVDYAVSQVQAGVRWNVIEGVDAGGLSRPAHFLVVVDDGAGNAPPSLIARTYAAVDAVRALSVTFEVVAVATVLANVSMTLITAPGSNHALAISRAAAAVLDYLATMEIGGNLPYTRLAQMAYDADAAIINVASVTLNGATADLDANPRQVVIPGIVTVS